VFTIFSPALFQFETTLAYRLDLEKRVTLAKAEKETGKQKTAAAE